MDEPERAAGPRGFRRPVRDRMPGSGRARRGSAEPVPALLDRFGLVLVLVVATVIVQSLIDVTGSILAATLTHAISGAALAVAVRAAGVTRRWRRATDVFVVTVLIGNVVLLTVATVGDVEGPWALRPQTLWLVAAVLVPAVVARRVLEHHGVTLGTVMGAVAAYLQIAVAYSCVFASLDALTSTPVFGSPVPTPTYTYASLATITTLGYGDVVPVTDLGRLLVMSEAVLGQVFLVTFVALIVNRFAAQQRRGDDPVGATAPPGGSLG